MPSRTVLLFFLAIPLVAWSAQADPAASQVGTGAPPNVAPAAPAQSATPVASQPEHGEGSPMYNIGFNEGCATSNLRYARQSGQKPGKDDKLYDSDTDYHDGWNKGYRKCEDHVDQGGLPVMGNSVIQ